MLAELMDDIERGGEWPEFMLELTTSMIPKETEPDSTSFSEREVMAGSAIAMRPINNASPIYSAWSSARWRAMTEWREQWLPQSMAGGRPNKEASDVTLEHALAMELAVMQNRSVGAMALDWAKFFDSINRDIGDALMKKLMTQDSSVEANNYISAESRFCRQARYRFKIGKATTAVSKTRGGGYFQGPSYSIQVALACMSVWTRLFETETRCKTCGFIDDSSLRTDSSLEEDEALTQLQEAWDKSKDFGNLAGAKLNETKVKMMASTTTMEKKMNTQFSGFGLKCVDAFILVGGVLTNGRAKSRRKAVRLSRPRDEKYRKVVTRIQFSPYNFEEKSKMLAIYATPVLTWGRELLRTSKTIMQGMARKVNTALHPNKWTRRSHSIVFTLCTHGHLIHPTMASDYTALHTVRRILKRRPDLQEEWRQVQREYEQNEEAQKIAMGPGIAFREIAHHLGWKCEEGLSVQRKDGSWMHLLETEDGAFSHIVREDQRCQAWSCEALTKRTCYDEVKNLGIDYSETVMHLRSKIDGKKKEKWVHPRERHDDQPGVASRTQDKHKHTVEERGALRSVMCNSAFTMETLTKIRGKARQQHNTCPFCDQGVCEDEDHMFWKCPAHEQMRRETLEKYTIQELEELPRMTKICGLVPNYLEAGEIKRAQDVQLMLMRVWSNRCKIAVSKWGKGMQRHDRRRAECADAARRHAEPDEEVREEEQEQNEEAINRDIHSWEERTEAFPNHWWEPRSTTNAVAFLPGPTVEVKVNRASWGFRRSWLQPLQWYWRQMSFDTTPVLETEYAEATTKDTAWVSLALDFRSASAEELALPGEREEDNTMWKMVQHFKAASLNLLKKLKAKVPKHVEQSRVMASLGLGRTAVEGRAKLVRPEAVNRAIHALAIQALTTQYKVFMKSLVKLPNPGKPLFDPHGDGEHEDPEPERKYLRTHPKRRMESFPWKPGQREYIASLPRYLRITEEMSMVHNFTAEAKQFHVVGPFSKDQPETTCTKCGVKIRMVEQYGRTAETASISVRWQRARTHCSGRPIADGDIEIIGIDAKEENRRSAARARNVQVDIWNTRNWAQLPRRHHYAPIVPANVQHLRCIRPNCGKEYHVKTLSCNLQGKSLGKCKGEELPGENNLAPCPLVWPRFRLCHQLSSRGRQK